MPPQLVFLGPEAGVLAVGKGRRRPTSCDLHCVLGREGIGETGGGRKPEGRAGASRSPEPLWRGLGSGGTGERGSGERGVQGGCEGTGRGGSYLNRSAAKEGQGGRHFRCPHLGEGGTHGGGRPGAGVDWRRRRKSSFGGTCLYVGRPSSGSSACLGASARVRLRHPDAPTPSDLSCWGLGGSC